MSGFRVAWVLAAAVALSGCDSGPSGPGTLDGSVSSGPVPIGAVVLEVVGIGIQGFEGRGDTQAYGATVSEAEGRHRVILVSPTGGDFGFGVRVEDLGADPPTATVVGAAGVDDFPKLATGIEVRIGG